jgi:hypothetical protein
MALVKAALKSSPFIQRRKFRSGTLTPPFDGLRAGFGKEERGDFWAE